MTPERKLLRILVLVIAILYFLVFMFYFFPKLGRAPFSKRFADGIVFYLGAIAISISLCTFVFQLGSKGNERWAIFSGLCLALSIILPIGHVFNRSRTDRARELEHKWRHAIGYNYFKHKQPWVRANESDLRQSAIHLRMLTKDIDLANEWLARIKKEKISSTNRRKLRQKILATKLSKTAYRKELLEKFVSLSRIWVREMVDGVENSAKEDKEAARWKIAGVFQEIDKNSLGNQDAEILLLYRRAQMTLGNPRTLQFESFK